MLIILSGGILGQNMAALEARIFNCEGRKFERFIEARPGECSILSFHNSLINEREDLAFFCEGDDSRSVIKKSKPGDPELSSPRDALSEGWGEVIKELMPGQSFEYKIMGAVGLNPIRILFIHTAKITAKIIFASLFGFGWEELFAA